MRATRRGVAPQVVADVYAEEKASAAAEYGTEFRRHIESFVSREAVRSILSSPRGAHPGLRFVL